MKTLLEQQPTKKAIEDSEKQWWHGHQVTCKFCKSVVMLEKGDDHTPIGENPFIMKVKHKEIGESPIGWTCPSCGTFNEHGRIQGADVAFVLGLVIVTGIIIALIAGGAV